MRRWEKSIEANLLNGTVTWTMGTDTARDVARFIRENCPGGDMAVRDADTLEAAADKIDGPS